MKRSLNRKRLAAATVSAALILLLIPVFSLITSGLEPEFNPSDARDGVKADLSASPIDGGLEITVNINNQS